MNIFIKATDTFTVNLTVGSDPTNPAVTHVAETEEELRGRVPNVTDVQPHVLTFRFPTYRDNAQTVDDSIDLSTGQLKFHSSLLRLHRMARLTKDWTFKDEEGKPVPINGETIGQLNPVLASYIGDRMEEVLGIL